MHQTLWPSLSGTHPRILDFDIIPGMSSGNHQRVSSETSKTKIPSDDMLHLLFDRHFYTNRLAASWERTVLVWTDPEGTEPQTWEALVLCNRITWPLKPRHYEGELVQTQHLVSRGWVSNHKTFWLQTLNETWQVPKPTLNACSDSNPKIRYFLFIS